MKRSTSAFCQCERAAVTTSWICMAAMVAADAGNAHAVCASPLSGWHVDGTFQTVWKDQITNFEVGMSLSGAEQETVGTRRYLRCPRDLHGYSM